MRECIIRFKLIAWCFREYCGTRTPILFRLPGANIILVSSPAAIRATLFNLRNSSTHHVRVHFIRNVLGLRSKAVSIIEADTSGVSEKPLPGSNIPPHRRILRMQQLNTFDMISKTGTTEILPKYIQFYNQGLVAHDIGPKWINMPDLFVFLRDLTFEASVNTLCGPDLLKDNPHFGEFFWIFDSNVHFLNVGLPSWFRPSARRARNECVKAISRWRVSAAEKFRKKIIDDSEMFDGIWGSKIMRDRNNMYKKFPEFDEAARSGADLGVIWA